MVICYIITSKTNKPTNKLHTSQQAFMVRPLAHSGIWPCPFLWPPWITSTVAWTVDPILFLLFSVHRFLKFIPFQTKNLNQVFAVDRYPMDAGSVSSGILSLMFSMSCLALSITPLLQQFSLPFMFFFWSILLFISWVAICIVMLCYLERKHTTSEGSAAKKSETHEEDEYTPIEEGKEGLTDGKKEPKPHPIERSKSYVHLFI